MGTEHVRRLVAGFAVVGVLAAGCSDAEGDPPGAEPSATEQSPTTSATPEETETPGPGPTPWPEPSRPAAMERDDIEGAKAAAEYFLSLHPYIFATGDLSGWESLSHPECEYCRGAADRVNDLHAEGGYAIGGEIALENVEASQVDGGQPQYLVVVKGVETPSQEYSAQNEKIRGFRGGPIVYTLALELRSEGWIVRAVDWEE